MLPSAYPQVAIGAASYSTYATVDDANTYLAADFTATAWRDLSGDDPARAIVTATRILDRQPWPLPIDPAQGHAIPFISDTIDAATQLAVMKSATIEMASAIATGFDPTQASTGSNIKLQKAGSVEQEFYYADPALSTYLPTAVEQLLALINGGGSGAISGFGGGGLASGTCGRSSFDRDYSQDVIP